MVRPDVLVLSVILSESVRCQFAAKLIKYTRQSFLPCIGEARPLARRHLLPLKVEDLVAAGGVLTGLCVASDAASHGCPVGGLVVLQHRATVSTSKL